MRKRRGSPVGVLDVGGTKILAAVDTDGVLGHPVRYATPVADGPDAIVEAMGQALSDAASGAGIALDQLRAVGISVPSPVPSATDRVPLAVNLGWRDYPLLTTLRGLYPLLGSVPIVLEEDANCAGLAEVRLGAGAKPQYRHVLYVTVSTGVGGAILVDGHLYRGASGFAGEVGHLVVDPAGPPCPCGRRGCLEVLISGTALARAAASVTRESDGTPLTQLGSSERTRSLFQEATAGNQRALTIITDFRRSLALGLAQAVQVLNPEAVILGGGVMESAAALLPDIRATFREALWPSVADSVSIHLGALGSLASLTGVWVLVRERADAVTPCPSTP